MKTLPVIARMGAACCLISSTIINPAFAEIRERVVKIPVLVTGPDGTPFVHGITLTVVYDDARKKSAFLILNHGRAVTPQERKDYGRARFTEQSRYFAKLGFAVFMPTRIGYGVTEGPDLESSGPYNNKDYLRSLVPAVAQAKAAVIYARSQSFVDPKRGILLGQSVGGFTTIGAAAENLPGVRLAINFAGGAGGDPNGRPWNPCQADRIAETYGQYGARGRTPTLWLYSSNDAFWGPEHPKKWVESYISNGGKAEFIVLPASGSDGHNSFSQNPDAWKPIVEAFLAKKGFRTGISASD